METSKDNLASVMKENQIVETIFMGLRDTKQAKLYWSYFILRRMFISAVAVFLNDYQGL